MGRKKTGLDRRIMKEATDLFYLQGYTNTGVQQIVERAGTNKPGLYTYFEGKGDLARQYLSQRNQYIINGIIKAGEGADSPGEFFQAWMRYTRTLIRNQDPELPQYNGCPVANFALQTPADDEEMQNFIRVITTRWYSHLVAYFRREIKSGRFAPQPSAAVLARRMLLLHQGAITMWKLTGRIQFIDEAAEIFEMTV